MVDNRSAGFFGIGGAFNFKSGDISGTAARTQDDKMGQGSEYFAQQQREEKMENKDEKYMDRSAILRATLNSLAMMNVANVINSKKQAANSEEKKQLEELRNTLENQHKKENSHQDNPQKKKKEEIQQQLIEEEELLEEQIEKEYNDFIDFDK